MTDAGDRAKTILAQALGLAPESVDDSLTSAGTPAWDSLAHMRIVAAIETERAAPLGVEEILSITRLSDIAALLG